MNCSGCEVLMINNVKCHEHGCPEAWRDEMRDCGWCGQYFTVEDQYQQFCDDECEALYKGHY